MMSIARMVPSLKRFSKTIQNRLKTMIGYMSIHEQVEAEFERARRRALFGRLVAWVRGDRDRLLDFHEIRKARLADNRVYMGSRIVEVSRIAGSVGRWREFDRSFMPVKASAGVRWKRVDLAFHRGEDLPPVRLYKLGDSYFVEDGNHRVSVARYQGVEMVDAEVTEFHPRLLAAPQPEYGDGATELAACACC